MISNATGTLTPPAWYRPLRRFTPLDRAVRAMVAVPSDDLVVIAVGLLLDRVVKDQQPVVRLDGADGGLDQRPEVARGIVGSRQEAGDLVMANRVVEQLG